MVIIIVDYQFDTHILSTIEPLIHLQLKPLEYVKQYNF